MIALRLVVALVRLYRLTLRQRAAEAHADGRPCCALTLWHVGQDHTAALAHLTRHKEYSHAPDLQPDPPRQLGRPAP